ncbi:hypothetical protein AKO1_013079, partial [Acrasis kona]
MSSGLVSGQEYLSFYHPNVTVASQISFLSLTSPSPVRPFVLGSDQISLTFSINNSTFYQNETKHNGDVVMNFAVYKMTNSTLVSLQLRSNENYDSLLSTSPFYLLLSTADNNYDQSNTTCRRLNEVTGVYESDYCAFLSSNGTFDTYVVSRSGDYLIDNYVGGDVGVVSSSAGLSTEAIIGICVGSFCLLCMIGFFVVLFFIIFKRAKRAPRKQIVDNVLPTSIVQLASPAVQNTVIDSFNVIVDQNGGHVVVFDLFERFKNTQMVHHNVPSWELDSIHSSETNASHFECYSLDTTSQQLDAHDTGTMDSVFEQQISASAPSPKSFDEESLKTTPRAYTFDMESLRTNKKFDEESIKTPGERFDEESLD